MSDDFRVIYKIQDQPPTFSRDHLTWELLPVDEKGIPYYARRNDHHKLTDEDHKIVQDAISFLVTPHYGPLQ